MSARLDQAIAAGLMLAVIFTALSHGAVEAWSVALFELMVIALLLLWAIKAAVEKKLTISIPATVWPVAALLLFGLAQSVRRTGEGGRQLSLSMDAEATRVAVTALFFLLASFILAANFLTSRERLGALAKFLVIYGLMMAVFALAQHFAWDGRFYWLRPMDEITSPFGPYVAHSHFAGYMELLLPVPIALIMTRSVRREARIFYGFAAVVMGVAIIASLSRGGMISLAAEMTFLAAAGARLRQIRRRQLEEQFNGRPGIAVRFASRYSLLSRTGTVSVIVIAIVAGVIWIGAEPVINRVTQGRAAGGDAPAETFLISRGWIWKDTLAMIKAHPVMGVGLGAFATAYPIYSQSDGSLTVGQAHNDYLQVFAEGGLVGGALLIWFIYSLFRASARGWQSRDPLLSGLALGASASIFGMLVHSLFDFNLQLPSHALLFLLLAAVVSHIGALATRPEAAAQRESEQRREAFVSAASS
jgi:O-antigen ligase